ncbi:hypothetical protein AK812_SmicGene26378 [Symbiodinium microadriaticum]|uniref:Uncharacterized protein n=1 Tax=Symbiodinium microadriaticum TaxID=2951 RepID=A0A1Q9D9R7_SYMMI|nr:hypothetical protein AK812_SmicGene26378 [Symbiodinium microadriaticum]
MPATTAMKTVAPVPEQLLLNIGKYTPETSRQALEQECSPAPRPLSKRRAYASGVPLATPLEDVDRLEGLPRLGGVAQMVHGVRVGLARDLAQYNSEASKSGHEQLSFDDALWGAVMVRRCGDRYGDHSC